MMFIFAVLPFYAFSRLFPKDNNNNLWKIILPNLNDFINNGITKDIFLQLLGNQNYIDNYNQFINLLTDKKLFLDENILGTKIQKISKLTNINTTLHSIFPNCSDFLINNKEDFIKMKPIFNKISSDLSKVVNIDSNIINQLYNYIAINEENDDIEIGKLLKILSFPTSYLTNVHNVFCVFETKLPISAIFEAAKSTNKYNAFIEKVEQIKIPNEPNVKFFSLLKIIDIISAGSDLMDSISKNFVEENYKKFFDPFVHKYIFKPLNIFELSLYDRSKSLSTILTEIDSFSEMCSWENSSLQEDTISKCILYNYTNDLLSKKYNVIGDTSKIQQALVVIDKFQNSEINLTDVLINDFGVSKDKIRFIFGLMANLTYSNKSYLDVMDGLQSKNTEHAEQIKNLSEAVLLVKNMNQTTNLRPIFDKLNAQTIWLNFTDSMCDLSQNKHICQYPFIRDYRNNDKCENLTINLIEFAKILITKQKKWRY